MIDDRTLIFGLFAVFFVLLVWGRIRYDLVAFATLMVAAVLGLVPADSVFEGFGHSAVAIIALVLIVSRGLSSSGAVELIATRLIDADRPVPLHIAAIGMVGGALSAIINNVAALALLMPLDIEAASKAKRPAGRSLMPLSFATILGGMITLIGTPPNIVIAQYRADTLGAPFTMFDFAPVGLTVAVAGIAFVSFVGWRLLPQRDALLRTDGTGADAHEGTGPADAESGPADDGPADDGPDEGENDTRPDHYAAELRVGAQDADAPTMVRDLYPKAHETDVNIVGLVRDGRRRPGLASRETLREGDFLIVEGAPKAIETFMGQSSLEFAGSEQYEGGIRSAGLTLAEAIVPDGARVQHRTAEGLGLLERHAVTLLGVSREGRRFRDRVHRLPLRGGDVLLLLGTPERVASAMDWLGVLPIEGRRTEVVQRHKAGAAIGLFLCAVALAVAGFLPLAVALAGAVVGFIALGLVSGREVYDCIEWKVIVLLACLIPLAGAFERSGGADLIADSIVGLTDGYPAWATLAVLMVVTMTMSDFLNNVATTLIAAPIGLSIAQDTGGNPDTYLMTVAVAASCAFLTPVGHKNNTIILGPGGYRFGDFWRMGLPLEMLVVAVAVPALLVFWPL